MTVVVGVDGSPPLRTALRLAAQEAHWRQVPLVAVSAYEPPFGLSAGGYPIGALHTGEDERVTVESALRDAASEELGDHAGQTDLRVSEGLAGHVIVETARQTHAQLVVSGEIPEEQDGQNGGRRRHRSSRRTGRFEFRAYLPGDVNADAVRGELTDGVLTLTIPKSEAAKPRKIEITG